DSVAADAAARVWSGVQAERWAAYGPKVDLARYGLDRPTATVTVTTPPAPGGAPESHTLALGRKAENAESYYARLDNGPGVAVLSPEVAKELTHAALDFADRTLFAFDPAELVAIRRRAGREELEITRTDDGWQITKPAPQKADQTGLDDLAERLAGLRAARMAELDAKDAKPYGLNAPAATVTLA